MSSDDDETPLVESQSWDEDEYDEELRRLKQGKSSSLRLLGVSFVFVGVVAILIGIIGVHSDIGGEDSSVRRPMSTETGRDNPNTSFESVVHGCAASRRCGIGGPEYSCQCDFLCPSRGDCCDDFFTICTQMWLTEAGVGGLVVGASAYEYFESTVEDVQVDAEEQSAMQKPSFNNNGHGSADLTHLDDVLMGGDEDEQNNGSGIKDEIDANSSVDEVPDYSLVDYCFFEDGGYCQPGHSRSCRPCDCCHWHSSCHRCPHGYDVDYQKCNSFSRARCKQKPVQLAEINPELLGTVSELYTYGAPATSREPLPNLQRVDRCFPGLRVYTEDRMPANLQVDAAAIFTRYKHSNTHVLALHWNKPSFFRPCPEDTKAYWPQNGAAVYANWGLHHEPHYGPRLECFYVDHYKERVDQMPEFARVHPFARMAYAIYGIEDDYLKPAIELYLPSWRIVADEKHYQAHDEDRVLLVQEQERQTWECLLVFEGTNSFGELFESVKSHLTYYCGFAGVHAGYRDEIWTLTHEIWPRLRNKLAKCSSLSVTGHSLGGAIAELFTACVNSNRTDDTDYKQAQWIKGTPGQIDEIQYQPSKRKSDRRREPTKCR